VTGKPFDQDLDTGESTSNEAGAASTDTVTDASKPAGKSWEDDPRFGADPARVYESYVHAQSKIGRQGQELGELRAELAELRELLEAAQAAPEEDVYGYEPDWEQLAGQPNDDPALLRAQLAAKAQAAAAQFEQAVGAAPPPPTTDQIVALAGEMLERNVPDWPNWQQQAMQAVAANPELHARLITGVQNGDSSEIALAAMEGLTQAKLASASELQASAARNAKLDAQTLSGSGDRHPASATGEQEEWERIRRAGDTYASRMGRGS
jgi:hypothetical protein